MRTLKFRAYDGSNNMFSYWTMNDLCTYEEKDEKPSALDDWQEWTGLLDKNGKEIYENDLLVDVDEPQGEQMLYRMTFSDRRAGFQLDTFLENDKWGENYIDDLWSMTDKKLSIPFEIIGNIYENPELLTQHNSEV